MKTIVKTIAVLFVWLCAIQTAHAQGNWNVNPADYQYTMTFTGIGELNCDAITDGNDKLAAFINGTCRGFVQFNTEANGSHYAYLIVYSNANQGETINFKVYDDSQNMEVDLLNSFTFIENGSEGTAMNPVLFTNNYAPTALNIENIQLTDSSNVGDAVASFTVVDTDNSQYAYSLTGNGADDAVFNIYGNELILNETIDYTQQTSYIIEVEAIDASGCSIADTFTIEINNTNEPPYDIVFLDGDSSILENEPIGSYVATLVAIDNTLNDVHTFSLESGGADNSSFEIQGDELFSMESFDFELKSEYAIKVKVVDITGNEFIKDMTVYIENAVEQLPLQVPDLLTPNNDGFNDYFSIPTLDIHERYQLIIYNDNGNVVFDTNGASDYNNKWTGLSNEGKQLPDGVYYYLLRDPNYSFNYTGQITLLNNQ